jgi:DNA-binding response OmpR family regulator
MENLLRKSKHLLCIDDYETALAGWCLYLQEEGYSATGSQAHGGLEIFATQQIDAVVLDYAMPELTGDAVAETIKRVKPDVPIIVFTGFPWIASDLPNKIEFLSRGSEPSGALRAFGQGSSEVSV